MKKSKRIWLITAFAVVFAVAAIGFLNTRIEPEYNGKSLSEWLEMGKESEEATVAVQAMGEDAIPFLVKRLKSNKNSLKLKFRQLLSKLGFPPPGVSPNTALREASDGFEMLGEAGIPTLLKLLGSRNRRVRHSTLMCLRRLMPFLEDQVDVFAKVLLGDSSISSRSLAAEILGDIGSTPEVVNTLILGLNHSEAHVRVFSALSLGRYDSATVMDEYGFSPMISLVGSGYFDGKTAASYRDFSPAITNAIPALEKVLNDPDKSVRAAAKFALDEIEKAEEFR